MKTNIINELGELAMSTRLMRISELTRRDVTRIYKEHDLDFESKWFPVFYILSKTPNLGVVELAELIGYTHQSVAILVKEMLAKKLLISTPDKLDRRKKNLSLTPKSIAMIKKFKPLWDDFLTINQAIYRNGSNLMKAVEDCESALAEEGFYERYKSLQSRNRKKKIDLG